MTERFDAEKWLRNQATIEEVTVLLYLSSQSADELAAAKLRIAEQGMFIVELEIRLNDIAGDWQVKELQLAAEQAMSRKLYAALSDCVDDSAELLVEYEQRYGTNYKQDRLAEQRRVVTAAREATAEYEKERK